jgi:hypothetical protein
LYERVTQKDQLAAGWWNAALEWNRLAIPFHPRKHFKSPFTELLCDVPGSDFDAWRSRHAPHKLIRCEKPKVRSRFLLAQLIFRELIILLSEAQGNTNDDKGKHENGATQLLDGGHQ